MKSYTMEEALEAGIGKGPGANIRHEGAIPVCGWCGFALIVEGPRQCCKEGAEYDRASTYRVSEGKKSD